VLLVPYDDDDLERLMLGRSPRFQALLNRSRESIKEGEGYPRGLSGRLCGNVRNNERLRQAAEPSGVADQARAQAPIFSNAIVASDRTASSGSTRAFRNEGTAARAGGADIAEHA
jgi:hypothetical protein